MATSDQPFLPDAIADAPPAKPRAARVVWLWVILVFAFLIVWQLLDQGPNPDAPPPSSSPAGFTSVLTVVLPIAVIGLFLFLFVRLTSGARDFNESQTPGFLALAEGRAAEALALLRGTLGRFAKKPLVRAVAQINVGQAALRAAAFDDAIAAFAEAMRGAKPLVGTDIGALAAIELARAYALTGDVSSARRWAQEGRAWLAKARGDRLALAAHLCVAEAMIAARAGDGAHALALLESNRLKLRHSLTANHMRGAEVVAAFAEASSAPDGAALETSARLARITPVLPGELTYLGSRWPEMRAFLARHGLGAEAHT